MSATMEQAIIQTLSYFAIFSYPLTQEELGRYLWKTAYDQELFLAAIASLLQKNLIRREAGYICLPHQKDAVATRQRRWWYTKERLDIAMRAAKKLRYIPFIEAVFVCNQLPVTADEHSDIDVFIVVKRERLWISRLLATLWLSVWGMRRHTGAIQKHICLSFYCTDDALDLSVIAIDGDDIYLAYWLDWLIPVFDPKQYIHHIYTQNAWVQRLIPRFGTAPLIDRYRIAHNRVSKVIRFIFEQAWQGAYGAFINDQAKRLQSQKMAKHSPTAEEQASRHVVISDHMLKFHENDRRRYFRDTWKQTVDSLI